MYHELEDIHQIECRLGRSYVVMRLVILEFYTTLWAFIFIRFRINVSHTEFSLEVPMLGEGPGITVCNTCTYEPTFVSVIFQFGEVGTEELEVKIYVTYVMRTSEGVEADEGAHHLIAEPVSSFWLNKPVLPLLVLGKCPRVVVAGYIQGPFWGKAEFEAEVHGACSIIKKIRLQGHLLSDGRADEATNSQ